MRWESVNHRWAGDGRVQRKCTRCGAIGMLLADGSWVAFRPAEDERSIWSFLRDRIDSCAEESVRQVIEE